VLRDIRDVIDNHVGRSRTVLEYGLVTKRLVDEAKKPGFGVDSWAPLAELVAIDEFERVGAFKEVMDWPAYVDFLTNWATSSEWECSLRRITETPRRGVSRARGAQPHRRIRQRGQLAVGLRVHRRGQDTAHRPVLADGTSAR
jgi:hypothetical protein